MKLSIKHQESFSRGELLLRTIFGFFYIAIPHAFLLSFVQIGAAFLSFLSFWIVLFTGKYPQNFFDYQVKYFKWALRVKGSMINLFDGTPAFGMDSENENVNLEIINPDSMSRGLLIVKVLFGWLYVGLPHTFCLIFRSFWGSILSAIAWWVVLFTGSYPQGWFDYQVGTLRWAFKYSLYLMYMTDDYPAFSGKA